MLAGLPVDQNIKQRLLLGGMDERLAIHFAYILSWDPTYLSQEDVRSFCADEANIFNAFQSGVWQHVRLKLPLPGRQQPGWRVEFRPMEVQPRDFENAAFLIFTFLLSRAIVTFDLDFYVPLDKVRMSMDVAQKRDAVLAERLYFRRRGWASSKYNDALGPRKCSTNGCRHNPAQASAPQGDEYALMSVAEIINGEKPAGVSTFPGLVSIVWLYLDLLFLTATQRSQLSCYLDFVSRRARGEIPTPARWNRSFVKTHSAYEGDSVVHQEICYDLMREIVKISE